MEGTSKGEDLVPSSKLLSANSLTTIGFLGTSFGAGRALEEVNTLEGTDVLEVAKKSPLTQAPKPEKVQG